MSDTVLDIRMTARAALARAYQRKKVEDMERELRTPSGQYQGWSINFNDSDSIGRGYDPNEFPGLDNFMGNLNHPETAKVMIISDPAMSKETLLATLYTMIVDIEEEGRLTDGGSVEERLRAVEKRREFYEQQRREAKRKE